MESISRVLKSRGYSEDDLKRMTSRGKAVLFDSITRGSNASPSDATCHTGSAPPPPPPPPPTSVVSSREILSRGSQYHIEDDICVTHPDLSNRNANGDPASRQSVMFPDDISSPTSQLMAQDNQYAGLTPYARAQDELSGRKIEGNRSMGSIRSFGVVNRSDGGRGDRSNGSHRSNGGRRSIDSRRSIGSHRSTDFHRTISNPNIERMVDTCSYINSRSISDEITTFDTDHLSMSKDRVKSEEKRLMALIEFRKRLDGARNVIRHHTDHAKYLLAESTQELLDQNIRDIDKKSIIADENIKAANIRIKAYKQKRRHKYLDLMSSLHEEGIMNSDLRNHLETILESS
jgi:hypothetical protein